MAGGGFDRRASAFVRDEPQLRGELSGRRAFSSPGRFRTQRSYSNRGRVCDPAALSRGRPPFLVGGRFDRAAHRTRRGPFWSGVISTQRAYRSGRGPLGPGGVSAQRGYRSRRRYSAQRTRVTVGGSPTTDGFFMRPQTTHGLRLPPRPDGLASTEGQSYRRRKRPEPAAAPATALLAQAPPPCSNPSPSPPPGGSGGGVGPPSRRRRRIGSETRPRVRAKPLRPRKRRTKWPPTRQESPPSRERKWGTLPPAASAAGRSGPEPAARRDRSSAAATAEQW